MGWKSSVEEAARLVPSDPWLEQQGTAAPIKTLRKNNMTSRMFHSES
jgi:hypothetical protein